MRIHNPMELETMKFYDVKHSLSFASSDNGNAIMAPKPFGLAILRSEKPHRALRGETSTAPTVVATYEPGVDG